MTYRMYTKKFIKINQAVLEEFGYKHCDKWILYFKKIVIELQN